MIEVQDKYIELTKKIILGLIDRDTTTVFLFGSRADNTNTSTSDLDIGFLGSSKIDDLLFARIRDELDDSIVPYHFDLIDFYNIDATFKNIAMEKIVLWNKSKNFN